MSKETTKIYGGRATVTFDSFRHTYKVTVPGRCVDLFQPSVTSILKMKDKSDALVNWAVGCYQDRAKSLLDEIVADDGRVFHGAALAALDNAKDSWRQVKDATANIGSLVHRVLEQEIKARAGLCERPALPLKVDSIMAPDLTADMVDKANNSVTAGLEFFDAHHIELEEAEAVRWSAKHGYIGTGDLIARVDGVLSVLDFKTGKRLYPEVFLQLAAYQRAYEEEHGEDLHQRIAVNVGRDGNLETQQRDNSSIIADFGAFLALLRAWRWHEENVGKWDYKERRMVTRPAPQVVGML